MRVANRVSAALRGHRAAGGQGSLVGTGAPWGVAVAVAGMAVVAAVIAVAVAAVIAAAVAAVVSADAAAAAAAEVAATIDAAAEAVASFSPWRPPPSLSAAFYSAAAASRAISTYQGRCAPLVAPGGAAADVKRYYQSHPAFVAVKWTGAAAEDVHVPSTRRRWGVRPY